MIMKPNIKVNSTRTFQKDGKWIEKPSVTEVVICACGEKYIKTRRGQAECLKCMRDTREIKSSGR